MQHSIPYTCHAGHVFSLDPDYDNDRCPDCSEPLLSDEYRAVTDSLHQWAYEDPGDTYSWPALVTYWRNAKSTEGPLRHERERAYGDWMTRIHDTADGRFITISDAVPVPTDYPYGRR